MTIRAFVVEELKVYSVSVTPKPFHSNGLTGKLRSPTMRTIYPGLGERVVDLRDE